MADNGKLYPGFTREFALAMAKLCGKANVVVPNLTEASFMLGIPYVESGYDEAYIKSKCLLYKNYNQLYEIVPLEIYLFLL